MKLRSVILADNSESCDIADLFVLLKNSTALLLGQYNASHNNTDVETKVYLSDSITKQNISEKLALVNTDGFVCFWYTFSCLNGNDLADALVANKVKAFIGYTDYANCPYGIDDVTTEIVMSFIYSFLEGKTVNEAKTGTFALVIFSLDNMVSR